LVSIAFALEDVFGKIAGAWDRPPPSRSPAPSNSVEALPQLNERDQDQASTYANRMFEQLRCTVSGSTPIQTIRIAAAAQHTFKNAPPHA
jgi:hypothetical protein